MHRRHHIARSESAGDIKGLLREAAAGLLPAALEITLLVTG
jgi:hypothetical protein